MTTQASSQSWRWVRFGDVVRKVTDRIDPDKAGIRRFVAGEHMETDDLRIRRWGIISDDYLGPAFHMRFRPGHVLYGSRRTYLRKVALADFEGVCANTTFVVEPSTDRIRPEFLLLAMTTDDFHRYSIEQSRGSVNPYINFRDLADYEFRLPPLDNQQVIVKIVERFEFYGDACLKALDAVRTLETSLLLEVRASGSLVQLGELTSQGGIQIGPFGSQLHAHEYVEEGVPVVMPSDLTVHGLALDGIRHVSSETAQRLAKHRVQEGDILLPRRGDLNKRALVTEREEGWLCGTGSVRVRLDEPEHAPLVERLLAGSNTTRWIESNAVGTTMPNLNLDIVSRIPLAMPSSGLRQTFSQKLTTTNELLSALNSSIIANRRARVVTLNRLLESSV